MQLYLVANNITYTCGNILKIINLRLAWTDASKSDCPIDPATNPKCGTLPSIVLMQV
jgi:hypothetical protein